MNFQFFLVRKVKELIISAKAESLEKAFSNIANNLFEIMIDTSTLNNSTTKTIIIRDKDLKSLLYNYLRKLHNFASTESLVLGNVTNLSINLVNGEYMLTGNASGEAINRSHKIRSQVKQITDRNIIIKEDNGGCILQIGVVADVIDEI